ncbi:MAG: hypothetical protein HFJ28_05675 [Clostridia bacterium]|jgi:hypothetical protein|nr:hypothetical protein [Clostridia bacterium]
MVKVRIFERLPGDSKRIKEAEVPETILRDCTDYWMFVMGIGVRQVDSEKHVFEVTPPCLQYIVNETEKKWPEIKFVEVKGKKFNNP